MSQYVSLENNSHFFEEFCEKNSGLVEDPAKYYLVMKDAKVALEPKSYSVFTRTYNSMWGSSYDVKSISQKIVDAAKGALQSLSNGSKESDENAVLGCFAASRTLLAIEQLVKEVEERAIQKDIEALQEAFLQRAAKSLEALPGPVNHPQAAFRDKLLLIALKSGLQKLALKLIEEGANVNFSDPKDGERPLHIAAKGGHHKLCESLLERGAQINALDRQGNTALHAACRALQVESAITLVKRGVDVAIINKEKYAAFCLPSGLPDPESRELVVDFYMQLFKSYRLTKDQVTSYAFLQQSPNPFEVALFFQDERIARDHAAKLSQKEFFDQLEKLKNTYPRCTLDIVEFSHLEVAEAHYQKRVPNLALRKPLRQVTLEELHPIFDRQKVNVTNKALSISALKGHIANFIVRVNGRAELIGSTPPWEVIEQCVKNCIISIQDQEKTPENLRNSGDFLKALIELQIGQHCAGEYFYVAQHHYRKICKGVVPSFEEEIYLLLAEHRERLLHHCVDPNKDHNLNDYNYLLSRLGEPLMIPGYETCERFLDPHGHADIDLAKKEFKKLYSPISIQRDCIEQALKNNLLLRQKFEEWCFEKIPPDWGKGVWLKVNTMRQKSASDEQIRAYLKENDITLAPNDTNYEKAIEEVRRQLYRACEIYDSQGNIRSLAISRLLAGLEKPVLASTKLTHATSPSSFKSWENYLVKMVKV